MLESFAPRIYYKHKNTRHKHKKGNFAEVFKILAKYGSELISLNHQNIISKHYIKHSN